MFRTNQLCNAAQLSSQRNRRGVSLLELMLALGLSTVVMSLIAMSISLNFRMYDTKRSNIEEAQLARSVLRHMADDIRAAVQHMPPDLSGLETVMANSQNAPQAAAGAALGGMAGGLGQAGGQNGGGQGNGQNGNQGNGATGQQQQQTGDQNGGNQGNTGGTGSNGSGGVNSGAGNGLPTTMSGSTGGVESQTQEPTSIYGDQQSSNVVGLYGTSTELQIDISRLPRVDQFQAEVDPNDPSAVVDIPSDMKTVTYFLRPEDGLTSVGLDGRGRGLMRRVLDRAVADYEGSGGGATGSLGEPELLAEEVVGLQFMYFDGTDWTSEWDSASMEGLPVAIEITLALQNAAEQEAAKNGSASSSEEPTERTYTLTVNLPTATTYEEKQLAAAAKEEETALSQTGALDTSGDAAAANAGAGGMGGGGMGGGLGGGGGQGGGGRGGQGDNGDGQGGPGRGGNGGFGGGGGQGPGGGGNGGPRGGGNQGGGGRGGNGGGQGPGGGGQGGTRGGGGGFGGMGGGGGGFGGMGGGGGGGRGR